MAKRDKEKRSKKAKAADKPRNKAKPLPPPKELTAAERSRNLRIAKSKAADKPAAAVPRFPLKAPDLMPGVVPTGVTPAVAMDYCPGVYEFAGNAYAFDPNFQGFPGYPYLANLATRAEYRAFASTMASELFREWIKIKSTSADETEKVIDNGRIAELEKAIEEYDLRGVFQRAAAQDCFFGRGQISVNIKGANDELPLVLSPKTVKPGSLTSFTTVEAIWTSPSAYNALDPTAPDFYKPREWFMLGKRYHASRMLTIITRPLPDILKPAFNFSGMSLSQLAEPYVNNWLRTRQSVSDLINNFSITALKTDMAQMLQGDCDGSDVLNRADFFTLTRSNRGLMMLDMVGEELVQINTPLSGLHELQAQSQEHMCSVSRIPAMILTGISPSGLNASSEGEIRAFYDWISSQQQSFYKHPLDICIKLLMLNLWGEIDETITFEFNPLWQTSAKEESEIRVNNANADAAYLDRSVVSQEEVRDKLSKDAESGYAGIDPGDTPELPEPEHDSFSNGDSDDGDNSKDLLGSDEGFEESKHPRAINGQFGSGGGGGKSTRGKSQKLTSNEKSAVSSYSGDDFLRVNAELRSGGKPDAQVERIDSAIEKSEIPSGTTLYRGMSRDAAKRLFASGSINAGDTVSDKAFASTTKSADIARQIGLGGVVLKIEVGDGQKGLDMSGLTRNDHEQEVLLPRDTKMTVLGTVAPKNPGDPVVVRVSYGK